MSEFAPETLNEPKPAHSVELSGEQMPGAKSATARYQSSTSARATEKLVDQRTLPWLELEIDQADDRDKVAVSDFPAMKDPLQFAAALRRAMPQVDLDHDGMSVAELKQYIRSHGAKTAETAAAAIALNHFDDFSEKQGVFNRLFYTRITAADLSRFEKDMQPFALVAKHPEIRNPTVFLSTIGNVFARIDTTGDGELDRTDLTNFVRGSNGNDWEKAAAALILANNKTLPGLAGQYRSFGKDDMLAIKALTNPQFERALAATVAEAEKNQSSVAGNAALGAGSAYAISSLTGSDHPGRAAVAAGVASALVTAYINGEPERVAAKLREKRQLLQSTAIFDLEEQK